MTEQLNQKRGRSGPEWITFAVASAVLLVVAGLIAVQIPGHRRAAAPEVTVGAVESRDGAFHVPVDVKNRGDDTAANVQVVATLTLDDEPIESDQIVDFLAGGATDTLVFVFAEDPRDGELEVRVAGFREP